MTVSAMKVGPPTAEPLSSTLLASTYGLLNRSLDALVASLNLAKDLQFVPSRVEEGREVRDVTTDILSETVSKKGRPQAPR
jgi:hypothetical protein